MYKNLYKDITTFILILAMIAFSFTITWTIFEIPYLTKDNLNGITIYYYDTESYLNNLQLSWNGLEDIWKELLPTRTWSNGTNIEALINNTALLFDYLYMPINLILTIVRSVAFIIVKLFSLLGIVTIENTIINGTIYNPPWFVNIFITIQNKFIIPYI